MSWMKEPVRSGACWFSVKSEDCCSGGIVEVIYGLLGIGSPHNHFVQFNDEVV